MIPFEYQTHGTTSPTLLRGGGRRTQCPSGGHTPASVTAPSEPADSRSGGPSWDETVRAKPERDASSQIGIRIHRYWIFLLLTSICYLLAWQQRPSARGNPKANAQIC